MVQSGWVLLWALFGLLFPKAQIYRVLSPFGLGLAGAVTGKGTALVGLTASIGYLLFADTAFPLRYVAALMLIGAIRWAFAAFPKLLSHPLFSPILVLVTNASVGWLTVRWLTDNTTAIWLIVAESAVAALLSYGMRPWIDAIEGGRTTDTESVRVVWLLLGGVTMMALSDIRISVITPVHVVAGVLILMMANALHERGGAILGITASVALILMHPDRWYLSVGFAFGGLLAGTFARFGRGAVVFSWVIATAVLSLAGGTEAAVLVGIYESVAAAVLYLAVPYTAERRLALGLFGRPSSAAADGFRRSIAAKLDVASRVMEEVSATVDTVYQQIRQVGASDVSAVYLDAAEEVCRTCASKLTCWKRCYSDTMAAFNDLTPILRERSAISAADLRGHLARNCPRTDELAMQVSRRYTEHRVREAADRRLSEIQAAVRGQFAGMSGIFAGFADDCATLKRVDTDLAARIRNICDAYALAIADAVCMIDAAGRMTVELLCENNHLNGNLDEWVAEISGLCDRPFCRPVVTPLSEGCKVTLHQATRYTVSVGAAQHICEGETVCGDAYEYFSDEEGRLHAVLSDGMGSGGRAAVDGAMTVGLTARMLRAGFGIDGILPILNAALMVGGEDETAATLDVLTVDLFSGDLRLTKAGAVSTLLISRGRVSRLHTESLPIGILQDAIYEQLTDRLTDGDVLLMMSDGVVPDGDGWLTEWLEQETIPGDMGELAQLTVDRALCREGDHSDDVTVLAIRLHKRE